VTISRSTPFSSGSLLAARRAALCGVSVWSLAMTAAAAVHARAHARVHRHARHSKASRSQQQESTGARHGAARHEASLQRSHSVLVTRKCKGSSRKDGGRTCGCSVRRGGARVSCEARSSASAWAGGERTTASRPRPGCCRLANRVHPVQASGRGRLWPLVRLVSARGRRHVSDGSDVKRRCGPAIGARLSVLLMRVREGQASVAPCCLMLPGEKSLRGHLTSSRPLALLLRSPSLLPALID